MRRIHERHHRPPVDERLPVAAPRGAGPAARAGDVRRAIAVPLIVDRALNSHAEQVALLISADLFCCGIVTLIQSLGVTCAGSASGCR